MAVVARGDAVTCLGGQDLVGLGLAVGPALLLKSRLEIPAAAAAAEVVGPVGGHVNKIFFTHNRPDHIPQVFGYRIAQGLSHQLAGILDREFYLTFLVPVRRGLELAVLDPLGIQLNNGFDFKVVRDVEFFQSCQDCKEFVPSLGVEPDFTAQILHCFHLGSDNFFPVLIICGKQAVVFSSPALGSISPVSACQVHDFP